MARIVGNAILSRFGIPVTLITFKENGAIFGQEIELSNTLADLYELSDWNTTLSNPIFTVSYEVTQNVWIAENTIPHTGEPLFEIMFHSPDSHGWSIVMSFKDRDTAELAVRMANIYLESGPTNPILGIGFYRLGYERGGYNPNSNPPFFQSFERDGRALHQPLTDEQFLSLATTEVADFVALYKKSM